MKKLLLLLFPLLVISSCCCKNGKSCGKKNNEASSKNSTSYTTPEAIAAALPGEWIWIKSFCCGRTSTWHTPETDGSTASLLFTKEKAEHFKNGKSQSSSTYNLAYFEEGAKDKIAYNESEGRKAMIRLSNDTLVVDYGYMDLQTEYYVRKK